MRARMAARGSSWRNYGRCPVPQLLIAIGLIALGWYGLKFFSRASPVAVVKMVRIGGGALAGLVGAFLLLRGRFDMGLGLIGAALWLSGFRGLPGGGGASLFRSVGGSRTSGSAGGRSAVRSATIEMRLDHASGAMEGWVIAGPFAGRPLEGFTRPECEALHVQCLRDDPDGARLLEAYMDRRFPFRGQAGEAQRDAGGGADVRGGRATLTEQEAHQILGLSKGAGREEIVRAHRTLMKKFHPDHGGTADAAARVNEAKEVLLRRMR